MRGLVTGATGFVGSHLVEHLLATGDEVWGISKSGHWPSDMPAAITARVPLIAADLAHPLARETRDAIAAWQPDVVFHLAAMSIPGDCGADEPTPAAVAANVLGTRHVLDLAQPLPHPPRIVSVSSCYVYGMVPAEDPVVAESARCEPYSGYGITKLAAEKTLLAAAEASGLEVVIARAFQHTGPRQSARMIVPGWARQLVGPDEGPIQAICLDTFLDLSDVRDVVRAYRLLAVAGRPSGIYNVGSGVSSRSGQLLESLLTLCHSSRSVVELSPGRRQHPIANIHHIRSETGWQPAIPMEQTLSDVLHYWRNQRGEDR